MIKEPTNPVEDPEDQLPNHANASQVSYFHDSFEV